jgi:hypothetical protein
VVDHNGRAADPQVLSILAVDAVFPSIILDHWRTTMKPLMMRLVLFALGSFTFGLSVGHAQIMNQLNFKMSQPFTVANTTFEAGSYVIRPVEGDSTVLEIVSASGHPGVMVDAFAAQPDSQSGSHLVFNKYTNVLALSEVFPSAGNAGYQLAQGHPEEVAAKTEKPTKQVEPLNAK